MTTFPGGFQNFAKTSSILSQETINQQQFPYHTFVIIELKKWQVVRQHTLLINPQEYSMQEAVRANVVQTLGGAYVDDFGRGLPKVTISGNTGYRLKPVPDGTALQDGWQALRALRNDIFRYFTDVKDSVRTYLRSSDYYLRWYNWGHDDYYTIQPLEFDLQQSVSQPLLYQYNFSFVCTQDITAALHAGAGTNRAVVLNAKTPNKTEVLANVNNLAALAAALKK